MRSLRQAYGELVSLTQLHILREMDVTSKKSQLANRPTNSPVKVEEKPIPKKPVEKAIEARPQPMPQIQTKEAPRPIPQKESGLNISEFSNLLREHLPQYAPLIREQMPDDSLAKQVKSQWKNAQLTPVVILTWGEKEESLAFLKSVAEAITSRLAPARLLSAQKIEEAKKWDIFFASSQLKLILVNQKILHDLPHLKSYFMKQTPVVFFDAALYTRTPELKRQLWQEICSKLKK